MKKFLFAAVILGALAGVGFGTFGAGKTEAQQIWNEAPVAQQIWNERAVAQQIWNESVVAQQIWNESSLV